MSQPMILECNICKGRQSPGQMVEITPNGVGGWNRFQVNTNRSVPHICKGETASIPVQGQNFMPQGQQQFPQVQYQAQPQQQQQSEFRPCSQCQKPIKWVMTGEYWPQGTPKAGKPKFKPWNPDNSPHSHPRPEGGYPLQNQNYGTNAQYYAQQPQSQLQQAPQQQGEGINLSPSPFISLSLSPELEQMIRDNNKMLGDLTQDIAQVVIPALTVISEWVAKQLSSNSNTNNPENKKFVTVAEDETMQMQPPEDTTSGADSGEVDYQ